MNFHDVLKYIIYHEGNILPQKQNSQSNKIMIPSHLGGTLIDTAFCFSLPCCLQTPQILASAFPSPGSSITGTHSQTLITLLQRFLWIPSALPISPFPRQCVSPSPFSAINPSSARSPKLVLRHRLLAWALLCAMLPHRAMSRF